MAPPDRAPSYAEVIEAVCRSFEGVTSEPFQLSIFGPQAVGKMAVGLEVQRLTGAPLLHAHLIIDLLTEFFEFGSEPFLRLAHEFRVGVIREAAAARSNLIVTGVPPFGDPKVMAIIEEWATSCRTSAAKRCT